jgi:carbonic anhydrase
MQKLAEGIHRFQNGFFSPEQRLFEGLVDDQHPLALFITCSDLQIDPSSLPQTRSGELFLLQNVGNIVPPYEAREGGADPTIENAVSVLGVKDIVICGHSHCRAMGALLDQSQVANLPCLRSWLCHAESTHRIIEENYAHITNADARLTATAEENVLVQLEHLQTYPSVAAALERKALNLHGWVYEHETGQVFGYRSQDGQFVPIEGTSFTTPWTTQ